MRRPSRWTWLWLAWLATFAVLEIVAARSHRPKPRTFSEHLWRWFPWRWRRVLLILGLAALLWHLASGVAPTLAGE